MRLTQNTQPMFHRKKANCLLDNFWINTRKMRSSLILASHKQFFFRFPIWNLAQNRYLFAISKESKRLLMIFSYPNLRFFNSYMQFLGEITKNSTDEKFRLSETMSLAYWQHAQSYTENKRIISVYFAGFYKF